jgi:hypothetical protein
MIKSGQLGQSIYGDNVYDLFGYSVDISIDGFTFAIGSLGYHAAQVWPRYVRVFSLMEDEDLGTSGWEQISQDITREANGDTFDFSVSLSEDIKTLSIGTPYANAKDGDDAGHVRVYQIDDSKAGWMQLGNNIDEEAADDYAGWSWSGQMVKGFYCKNVLLL